MAMASVATVVFYFMTVLTREQTCSRSGTPAWSEQLRTVLNGCAAEIPSRDGTLSLRIDEDGHVEVFRVGGRKLDPTGITIEPPGMASWSPGSDAFFVNDGKQSGMSSVFRLFRIVDNRIVEDKRIQELAVKRFRGMKRCGSEASDPNVWGLGWSADAARLYVFVQASHHQPCGPSTSFIGMVVKLDDDSIAETLSEAATKRRFRSLLFEELYRE